MGEIDEIFEKYVGGQDEPGPQEGENKPEDPKSGFSFVHVSKLEVKKPRYLVQNFLEWNTFALIFGDPGCGKSFVGIDIVCCVGTGTPYHGMEVEQGACCYIAGEGQGGIARRFMAWAIRNGIDHTEHPIYVSLAPAALCDEEQARFVVEAIKALPEKPVLVVIDTLARNFGPGDENSTQDMSMFIQAADRIRALYGSTVLIIHHTGHSDKSRARGAMALKGALDAEYRMDKDMDEIVRIEATKMKDAPKPEPLAFKIRSVELGLTDDNGEPVTSAVLDQVGYVPNPKPGAMSRGKNQVAAVSILKRLERERRETLERKGYDPDGARVSVDDWRNACCSDGMKRDAFYHAKKSLEHNKEVSCDLGFVVMLK